MIRAATAEDIPRLVQMGLRFVRDTPRYRDMLAQNADAMSNLLAAMMDNVDGALLIVDDVEGAIRGMLGAFLYEHPMSGQLTASETFWWADPETRGGGVGLMRHAERWAKERGAINMQMVAPNPRVGNFYARVGYEEVETIWQIKL